MRRSMLFEAVIVLLLIVLISLLYMAVASGPGGGTWVISSVISAPDSYSGNMFPGEGGTLYTFDGSAVHAISGSGRLLWSYVIPMVFSFNDSSGTSNLSLAGDGDVLRARDAVAHDGNLYMLVGPESPAGNGSILLALSHRGQMMWQVPFIRPEQKANESSFDYPMHVMISKDMVFVYTGPAGLTMIGTNGTVLRTIGDICSVPSVDEEGNFYATSGTGRVSGGYLTYVNLSVGAYNPDGALKWQKSYDALGINDSMVSYQAYYWQPFYRDNTLYVWSGDGVAALDRSGERKWGRHIKDGALTGYAIDGNDTLYMSYVTYKYSPSNLSPSGVVFVGSDGSILDNLVNETALPLQNITAKPLHRNGSMLIWYNDGIAAFDNDYRKQWELRLDGAEILGYGYDQNDTLYFAYTGFEPGRRYPDSMGTMAIAPDGSLVYDRASENSPLIISGTEHLSGDIYYTVSWELPGVYSELPDAPWYAAGDDRSAIDYLRAHGGNWEEVPGSMADLSRAVVNAHSLKTGELLWHRIIPQVKLEAVLTSGNVGRITVDRRTIGEYNALSPEAWYTANGIPEGSEGFVRRQASDQLVSNDRIYVNVWSYNYEVPAFYNQSLCVYAGGIYVLDLDGRLLWSKATESRVVGMEVQNGTVFYGSGDGRLSATSAGIAGGILAASSYLFFRFFFLGVVSRARTRLDRNSNRNRVFEYVRENPGASMYEISQALALNLGTVRYHLLVLGMNHRITEFRADEKYVRYFTNAGSYDPKDQLVISLMRRRPLRKVLNVLREKPGLTNLELSRELGAPESSTMRNLKELVEKGVVVKSLLPDGKIAYFLNDEYRVHTVSASELLAKNGVF